MCFMCFCHCLCRSFRRMAVVLAIDIAVAAVAVELVTVTWWMVLSLSLVLVLFLLFCCSYKVHIGIAFPSLKKVRFASGLRCCFHRTFENTWFNDALWKHVKHQLSLKSEHMWKKCFHVFIKCSMIVSHVVRWLQIVMFPEHVLQHLSTILFAFVFI